MQSFSSNNCSLSPMPPFPAFGGNSIAISSLNCFTAGRCGGDFTGTLFNCTLNATNFPNVRFSKVAYSPDGTCLAAIDCSTPTNVLTFSINPDCTLSSSPVSTQPLAGAVDLAFSPTSNCLVVVSATSPNFISHVTSYSFDPKTCSISSPQTVTGVGVQPTQLSFSPDGNCIAVANESNQVADAPSQAEEGVLEIYSINSATCSLALVQTCTPNSSELGRSVGWSPNGNCLYFVTNANIYAYSRNTLPPVASIQAPESVCEGETLTLNATPTGGSDYSWSTPRGTVDTGSTAQLVVTNVMASDAGPYTVKVTANGCTSASSAPVDVSVVPCNFTTLCIFECCPRVISACDEVKYRISIKNTGSVAALNLKLVDLLPECLTFLSATGTGWSFTSEGQQVTGTLSNEEALQPGAITRLIIRANANCAACQKITNEVTVTADNVAVPQTSSCCTKVG